jgi:hypothetical protein
MKLMRRPLLWMLLALASSPLITACDEGPLEEAGEEIDDAVDDAKDKLD